MATLEPISSDQWGPAQARHLLNRAGFGIPHDRVTLLAAMTPEEAVNTLLDFTPAEIPAPDFLVEPFSRREMIRAREAEGLTADEVRLKVQQMQTEERQAIEALKGWWLNRMYNTTSPLEEKLTLMWHGHFAVSSQKVKSSWVTYDMNRLLRKHGAGNFKTLTTAVGQSPAMLDYLDNRKSTKNEPNENWARELMELFTLGQGHYTEQDIKESARAFTGWMCTHKEFVYEPRRHDFGQKTFMGRTGDLDGWQVLDVIFEQPALAEFISGKLWAYFAYEGGEKELTQQLAKTFRENNYELKPVLKTIFLSQAFYSPKAMGSQIKSPAQFLLQLCHDMGLEALPDRALALGCRQLGQDLFYPPNVKGWDGNRAWINANSLLIRYNAPPTLIAAAMKRGQAEDSMMMQSAPAPDMTDTAATAAVPEMKMEAAAATPAPAPSMTAEQRFGNWRKEAMAQAREKMKSLPPAERKVKMQAFKEAGPREKMMMLREIGIEPPVDTFKEDPLRVFDEIKFGTGAECVAALEQRLLVTPMNPQQRTELLAAIGISDAAAPLDKNLLDLESRRALLRLVTSLPQYQLC